MSGEIHHWEDDTALLPQRRKALYEEVQKAGVAAQGSSETSKDIISTSDSAAHLKNILNCIPLMLYHLVHQLKPEE